MLKDITLGQFFPGNSLMHRLDARFKLSLAFVMMVLLVSAQRALPLALMALFIIIVVFASEIKPKVILKSIRPVITLILFTAALNMFFTPGRVLWELGFLRITHEGVVFSALMAVRVSLLITGTSVLTYTTSPIMLTDAIEGLFSPLKRLNVPVGELAMMMTIALRFIPTLLAETERIMASQKARGADLETGGMIKRIKAFVPVLVPVFVGAFKRADELALAMESRCYKGGNGRTRMKVPRASSLDWMCTAFCLIFFAGTAALMIMGV